MRSLHSMHTTNSCCSSRPGAAPPGLLLLQHASALCRQPAGRTLPQQLHHNASTTSTGCNPGRRRRIAAAAAAGASPQPEQLPPYPWSFGAQTNERYLQWDVSAQIALVKIWLAQKMQLTVPEVEVRLDELANLLPDLVGKIEAAQPQVLLELLADPAATAARLLALRELLPRANVSALVAGHPRLLLSMTVPEIGAKVAELRQRLPGVDVDGLVGQEPMLLRADLPRLMSELARLMPGADHVRLIAADPQLVLDMDTCGMPSTLEMDGVGLEGGS